MVYNTIAAWADAHEHIHRNQLVDAWPARVTWAGTPRDVRFGGAHALRARNDAWSASRAV